MSPNIASVFVVVAIFAAQTAALNGTCSQPLLGSSTSGLLDAVTEMQNTLGYAGLDSIDARKVTEKVGDACTLRVAKMINKKGAVVKPSSDGAQAAVRANAQAFIESSCPGFGLCAEIYDGKDSDVWPISTLTYMIVPTNTTDWEEGCDKMKTLYDYVKWILEDETASDIAKELSMATMPVIVAQQAKAILDEMKCIDQDSGVHFVKDRVTRSESLEGSGSSLQAGLQTRLTNEYFQQNFISISYTPSSSGNGRAALRAREFDFSGSDSILDMEDPEFIRRGMRMIPAFAAAVGVVFNVDQVEELVLSRDVMHKVFTGEIFSWRDPAILADNPDIADVLPDEAVIRAVRESKSGTTSALTKALYAFAGHPTDAAGLDYSLHVLGGSGLPDWPIHPQPYPGNTVCKFKGCIRAVCEPGHFLDTSVEACVECPQGTFSNTRGQHSQCELCPAGSYTNTVGNSKCVKCDDQKYQNQAGQQTCKACPLNSRRFSVEVVRDGVQLREQTPGIDIQECKCVAGFWLPASVENSSLGGQDCVQCPDGATCHGFPRNIPQTKRGFWGNPEHPQEFFECSQDACLKEFECAVGHKGRLCADPVDGYFTIGELWFFQCPANGYRAIFTIICVLCVIAVWMFLHHFSLKYDAFAIAFLFFQMIGIISKFRLRWHPNLNFVLIALRIINFDVDFFGPQCMFPGWNASTAFFMQLLLPFIVVAAYTLYFYAMQHFRKKKEARRGPQIQTAIENKGYLRSTSFDSDDLATYLRVKGLSYLIMMFHTLAFRAFSVFMCESDSDGEQQYMVSSPTLKCWTSTHIAMTVFSVLYIPTVICGVPLYLLREMVRMKREDKLCDFTVTVSYWFIFSKFKVAYPFWELVLLSRRFVLVLILVFVPVSMLQAALAVAFLNGFLYLHLTNRPFKDIRVGLLDSFGVCCSMAYAVCGMLFYPSLDYTLECVGSANLDELGEQCNRNSQLKQETSIVLLLLLFFTLLAALYISFRDIQEKLFSAAAAKKIEADKKWYGKDKLFKAIRSMPKGSRSAERIASLCNTLETETSLSFQSMQKEHATMFNSARDLTKGNVTKARKTVDMMMDFRKKKSTLEEVQEHEFANPEKLNLCDMLVGDYLQNWHKSLSTLSEKELAVRLLFADQSESQSMRQELAYMDLEMWIPAFAVRHELVNSFFSNNELARILRKLIQELPELINWLATVEHSTVVSFSNFINSYAIFAKTRGDTSAFRHLIVPVHKGQVVHWLMQCSPEEQRQFLTLFGAMNNKILDDNSQSVMGRVSRAMSPISPITVMSSKMNRVHSTDSPGSPRSPRGEDSSTRGQRQNELLGRAVTHEGTQAQSTSSNPPAPREATSITIGSFKNEPVCSNGDGFVESSLPVVPGPAQGLAESTLVVEP